MMRVALLAVLAAILAGCNTLGKSNREAPTPLQPITATVRLETRWAETVGAARDRYSRLQPAVSGGVVYAVGGRGEISAIAVDTGKVSWKSELDIPVVGGVGIGERIVAIGSTEGVVVALSRNEGKELWRASVASEVLTAPAIAENTVAVRTGDGRLVGIAAADGKILWNYRRTVPALSLRGTAAPVIVDSRFVVSGFADGGAAMVELASGRVVRELQIGGPTGRTEIERLADVDGTPRVAGSVLYAGSYHGRVSATDMRTSRILWSFKASTFLPVALNRNLAVIVDESGVIHAVDSQTGHTLWRNTGLRARQLSAPAIVGRHVVVGDAEGYLHVLSVEDGSFAGRISVADSAVRTEPVPDTGDILVLSQSGRLVSYRIAPL
jgi:outer membrane protein assembly factor BamB